MGWLLWSILLACKWTHACVSAVATKYVLSTAYGVFIYLHAALQTYQI